MSTMRCADIARSSASNERGGGRALVEMMEERGEGGLGVVEVQGAVYIERLSGFFGTLDRCEQQANGTWLAAKTVFVRCESHPPSKTM